MLDPTTTRQTCGVLWYGQHTTTLQLTTGTTLWHTVGLAPLPVRWVLVRNAPGRRPPVALVCTDPSASAEHMVARYVDRWQISICQPRDPDTCLRAWGSVALVLLGRISRLGARHGLLVPDPEPPGVIAGRALGTLA